MVQEEGEIVEEEVETVQREEPQSPGQQQQLNVSLFLSPPQQQSQPAKQLN